MAGSVITEAGNHPNVKALVYIAAFALDTGERCASIEQALQPASKPAWKTKPTWYTVATADCAINPEQERMMVKRAKAKTSEVKASHVAYMSHPKETAKLIVEAATSSQ